ncbi:MAG: UDP-N-acetylglucosamine pyrophosphorylase, partial [Kiritimatiellaeota bacterium]|nr:UDP-N-acetylglucosamine pyrophosphorylase [Kiritimatiellota bacterium]
MIILHPPSTFIADDVNPAQIAPDVTLHPGCRLSGKDLSIGPGSVIGGEGPATVINCQLDADVHLAGGYFERATFLDGFRAGSGAHVRPGCLFEEGSSLAHSVGVKQTVFLPWVTAGSLINFCDALMAGGTSRKDHSEIGSSYIHFNFTPQRDKATPSLIGDVPRGVLLNCDAIFLGGQGGIVGPCKIEYGTVIPAGQIWRGDVTAPKRLVAKTGFMRNIDTPYDTRAYSNVLRVARNNLTYIGNILALDAWYRVMRAPFMSADPFQRACRHGALQRISEILKERLSRLDEFARNVANSPHTPDRALAAQWASAKDAPAATPPRPGGGLPPPAPIARATGLTKVYGKGEAAVHALAGVDV